MTRDLLIVDKVRKSFGGLIAVGGDAEPPRVGAAEALELAEG